MRKVIFAVMMLMASGSAFALSATLISDNLGSGAAAPSTLLFNAEGAAGPGGMAVGAVPSTATWDWDSASGVLTGSGLYFPVIHIGSNPMGATILGDHVVDLVIDTQAGTTSATSYECREGNFLAGVGANGCLNLSLGNNFALDSTVAWNVGGDANCVNRSVNPDDISTGNPRGLFTAAAGGGCDAVDGAFDLWSVIQDPGPGQGGVLIIGNSIAANQGVTADGARTMTFDVQVVPVPAAVWLFGSAIGLLGWIRRRTAA